MQKLIVFTFCSLMFCSVVHAQSANNQKQLQQLEQAMAPVTHNIINAEETEERLRADSAFTRMLVNALRTPYSFYYPFDSLKTISRLYAPDSSFRIITWQIMKDPSYFRYKGAIQMNSKDGSLKLIPLYDGTDFTDNPVDSVRSNKNWIGAIYYNIIQNKYNNRNYYTLLGYDENDANSTKKWMEVLTFDENNQPVFGGRYFNYPPDSIKPAQPAFRFCLEFKKYAGAKLNYDPELKMIIFAKLVSESNDLSKKHTLVPYGTYEGFKWESGKWVYVPAEDNL